MKLDHIGVVVKDIDQKLEYYRDFFKMTPITEITHEPAQDAKVVFLNAGHGHQPMVELIQPLSEKSTTYQYLQKTGGGIHHFCYVVENLDNAIAHFKEKKCMQIRDIYPGAGHGGNRAVWFFSPQKELFELIEANK